MLEDIPRDQLDPILFNALRAIYKFQQAKMTAFGLDYEDIYLLQLLRNHTPSRMGEIADEMGIPISTATRVVDRLEEKKLLSRKKDPRDKRNILVSLEQKGKDVVNKVENQTFQILSKNLSTYNDEDIASFYKTAVHLHEILKVS
ncbi:MAG TPA: MarR family transcriptional regulator [Spirochaetota bacterium]|nr:MarR family transcriptional regulator [Spirochaetota bacterium]HPL15363.1 MarR family transcriptional regulator [Spirochaetota bacterium]HQF08272.1 MarR family transcriptional regulator [Spirochaetota bacterium]HQH97113.1 MarR family transcriptional regulator [Spirochaetota bacterium]HQJ70023.1 MarR family transcriptional regulator [Spirochaetota bacterium]